MSGSDFVHLHVHTTYSLLDGQCPIGGLVRKARELRMPAVAITDHGNLFGVKAFYDECRKEKGYDGIPPIKPILGCEAYIVNGDYRAELKASPYNHLCILAKNLAGYHNLVRLISYAHCSGFYKRPRIDKKLLEKHREGLCVSAACLKGEIPWAIFNGKMDEAEKAAIWYKDLFGDDFSLEIMEHRSTVYPDINMDVFENQRKVTKGTLELGRKLGIRVIATNDVHFLNESDRDAHEVLLALSTGKKLSDENRMRYTGQEWFKTREEMEEVFPGLKDALNNTMEVAERIEEYKLDSDEPIMPKFPIPPEFGTETDEKYVNAKPDGVYTKKKQSPRIELEAAYLRSLAYEGAARRWPGDRLTEDIRDRIDFELGTIHDMGFPGYFLIVHDYIDAARKMGVSVGPGRGSAAGAAVSYALGITNIDPLRYDLLFERFLNPDRISMPDIDVDFDDLGRGKVLQYVVDKYGQDHVAHIVTFGQMAPKSAIKDVCRVMDLPIPEANAMAAKVPNVPKITMKKALDQSTELMAELEGPNPVHRQVIERAMRLDGSVRQPGVHACGVLISRDPLIDTLPVMPTKGETLLTTQYDGHFVEPVGLLKMDFLGLRTLTIIKDCLALVKKYHGKDIDIEEIPVDDKPTFDLLSRGATTAVFQFESAGMSSNLQQLKPNRIEDLVAMNALYRPGPMSYIPSYIARKNGLEQIRYDHPLMEEYLKDTYGVTVYQEQVMLLSRLLGGFTRGMSDTLRKAMGKKDKKLMDNLFVKFVDGCLANPKFMKPAPVNGNKDSANSLINKIWGDWLAFAEYAFNKSHAVCYAWIAYQTAYLKANYSVEFMCANLCSEIGNFDKLSPLISACTREMGIRVIPPDVNKSWSRFEPEGSSAIRFGLSGIKGVGGNAADAIVSEREANGPFKSLTDLCSRVDLATMNRRSIEALASCGAMDCFDRHRALIFNNVERAMTRGAADSRDRKMGQTLLFDLMGGDDSSNSDDDFEDCEPWSKGEILSNERDFLGVYMSGHPLHPYRRVMPDFPSVREAAEALQDPAANNRSVKMLCVVSALELSLTKKDKRRWAKVSVEDDFYARLDLNVFPSVYEKCDEFLVKNAIVVVCGTLRTGEDSDEVSFNVREIHPASSVFTDYVGAVELRTKEGKVTKPRLEALKTLLKPNGVFPVGLSIELKDGCVVRIQLDDTKYRFTPTSTSQLEELAQSADMEVSLQVDHGKVMLEEQQRRFFSRDRA